MYSINKYKLLRHTYVSNSLECFLSPADFNPPPVRSRSAASSLAATLSGGRQSGIGMMHVRLHSGRKLADVD